MSLSTRHLCRTNLFFLLACILNRKDIDHPWLFARCQEVQAQPDGYLDLWAREHYKSTVITFAKTIQDILCSHGEGALVDRECTVGIFSHTRPIAKGFLRQIKREFENNKTLIALFPDIFYENPERDASKWSEDDGLVLKRKGNPKESTLEAHGLIDGQPVGKHFTHLIYDDVVVMGSVTSPDMMHKTLEALEMSYSLGAEGGVRRFIGTRYHFNDAYKTLIDRGTVKPRIYPATDDGTMSGKPVLLSQESLDEKRRDRGPYVFSSQMLLNPKADETQGFKREWVEARHAGVSWKGMNTYLLFDPASGKKKTSDYTAGWAVGLSSDNCVYVLDMVRDRLNLPQRTKLLMDWHRKYDPIQTRYEKYGKDGDVEHIQEEQKRQNYRFEITVVAGQTPKNDRIKRLIPYFESNRIILPKTLHYTDYNGRTTDLVTDFIEQEFLGFPVGVHDDMCFVAGTMIETNRGSVPIEHVKKGDMALTPDGYLPVIASGYTGVKKVMRYKNLEGTSNHPVFTIDGGYKTMDTLTRLDETIGVEICDWIKIALLKSLCSTEENSGGWAGAVDTIYLPARQMPEGKILRAYMSLYGSLIQDRQFLKVMKLTTKTAIHLIASLRIWSALQLRSIGLYQRLNCLKKEGFKLQKFGLLPQHGTEPLRAEIGIGGMLLSLSKKYSSQENIHASFARRSLFPQSPEKEFSFALNHAETMQDQGLGIKSQNIPSSAVCAEKSIKQSIKKQDFALVPVITGEEKPVYNLTVDGANCYFANGILVHNCDALARLFEPDLTLIWPRKKARTAGWKKSLIQTWEDF